MFGWRRWRRPAGAVWVLLALLPAVVYAQVFLLPNRPILAGGAEAIAEISLVDGSELFLPVVAKPPFAITGGSIKISGDRAKGLTIFSNVLTPYALDISDLRFSVQSQVVEARACWTGDNCSASWVEYPQLVPFGPLTPTVTIDTIGVQQINVEFRYGQPVATTITEEFIFFYIPDGDFIETDKATMEDKGWQFTAFPPAGSDAAQKPAVEAGQLALRPRGENPACSAAKIGSAAAGLFLHLPPHSEYRLYVAGDVFTQDQNPSNSATYDAFEITINGGVVARYSNQQGPITCNNPIYRLVAVNAQNTQIPLSDYSGEIFLNLENHLRYDDYFNTYTVIRKVWIDR